MGGGSGLARRAHAGPPGALCIFVFVAGVKLTSLAHELGSTPCSVAVFAILSLPCSISSELLL